MDFDEMIQAMGCAEYTIENGNRAVGKLVRLCVGRLRSSDTPGWVLKRLKEELRSYNIHTGTWRV